MVTELFIEGARPAVTVIEFIEDPPSMSTETTTWDLTTYENRLRTFNNDWKLDFITPAQMAQAGLYYLGKQDHVRCMFCSKDFDYWQEGDDPLTEHKRLSPHCSFFQTTQGARPAVTVIEFIEDPPSTSTETPTWVLNTYEKRLETFNNRWQLDFITPAQMAQAGLYYSGRQDCVKCIFCSKEFDYWQEGDDPLTEHKRLSPHCSFFQTTQGYDVCGLYGSLSSNPTVDETTKKIRDFLDLKDDILQSIRAPKTRSMETYDARLKTFKNLRVEINQDIGVLCEAGFYYLGDGQNDMMVCFYCGQGLKGWEVHDQPWREHARWSPTCGFVLLSRGGEFVAEVLGLQTIYGRRRSEDVSELNANHNDASILESSLKFNVINRKPDQAKHGDDNAASSSENLPLLPQDPKTPESFLCKICFKEPLEVAFFPCGHAVACTACSVSLETCPVCRQKYYQATKLFIVESLKKGGRNQLPCSSSQSPVPVDPTLCKVCCKEEMSAVFIPCRHVATCLKCAPKMSNCPVCQDKFIMFMHVYL